MLRLQRRGTYSHKIVGKSYSTEQKKLIAAQSKILLPIMSEM